jgi:hypothetical protein
MFIDLILEKVKQCKTATVKRKSAFGVDLRCGLSQRQNLPTVLRTLSDDFGAVPTEDHCSLGDPSA